MLCYDSSYIISYYIIKSKKKVFQSLFIFNISNISSHKDDQCFKMFQS